MLAHPPTGHNVRCVVLCVTTQTLRSAQAIVCVSNSDSLTQGGFSARWYSLCTELHLSRYIDESVESVLAIPIRMRASSWGLQDAKIGSGSRTRTGDCSRKRKVFKPSKLFWKEQLLYASYGADSPIRTDAELPRVITSHVHSTTMRYRQIWKKGKEFGEQFQSHASSMELHNLDDGVGPPSVPLVRPVLSSPDF